MGDINNTKNGMSEARRSHEGQSAEKLLTIKELSIWLGIAESTIYSFTSKKNEASDGNYNN
jgi:hypothetical protein